MTIARRLSRCTWRTNHDPLINAVPIPRDELSVTQYFDVSGTEYSVKVFVLNRFDNDPSVPDQLARAQVYR